jgi:hypothetical protein
MMSSSGTAATSSHVRRSPWTPAARILLAASIVWCLIWFFHALHYWEDDAYIHLEFARSFAAGQGFAFNGHVVYGDTSPLWVFLLAAFQAVMPGWIAAGKLLSACGVVPAGLGAFFFARKLTADNLFAAAMVLLFVVNPYFNYWAFSGMETIAATGMAFWGVIVVSDRVITWPRFLAGCLIAGLGPITRPEMVFLSAILGILLLYRWKNIPGTIAAKLPGLLAGLVLAAGPTVAWSIYALHAFGRIVPNTNAAKRADPHDHILVRVAEIYAVGFPVALLGVLAALGYLIFRLSKDEATLLSTKLRGVPIGVWVYVFWSAIATLFYQLNHTFVQTRYVFVTASGLVISVLAVLYLASPRIARGVSAVAVVVALGISVISTWTFIANKTQLDRVIEQAAYWIDGNLPPDALVATYGIGEIAFVSRHPIVDTGGITRPGVIPFLYSTTGDTVRWARSEGAQYYMSGEQPMPGATLVFSAKVPEGGWSLNSSHYHGLRDYNIWKLPQPSQP